MKRSELTVGAELYCASNNGWETSPYGTGYKAVVVAVEPYRQPDSIFRSSPVPTDKGTGVLVDLYNNYHRPEVPNRKVVRLAHLRGPYAETKAHVDAVHAELDRQREEQAQQRDKAREVQAQAYGRAKRLGLDVKVGQEGRIAVAPADLERLLDAFEARGGAS